MQKHSLFTDKFPDNATNSQIKKLFDQNPQYDPYYIATASIKDRKEKVDAIWNIFQPYASKHFLKEYKLKGNFHPRTWEMYLGATFVSNKIKIETSKKDDWPDFILNDSTYIECVTCKNANDENKPDYVPPVQYGGKVQDVPEDQILMRMTSVIYDKWKAYQDKLKNKGDINPDFPFLIAVNSGELGHQQDGVFPLIYKILFGIHDPVIHFKREGIKTKAVGFTISKREKLFKYANTEKSPINLNIFQTKEYSDISGIIFCNKIIVNSPANIADIGKDCLIIPNSNAKNPIKLEDFPFFKHPEDVKSSIKVMI